MQWVAIMSATLYQHIYINNLDVLSYDRGMAMTIQQLGQAVKRLQVKHHRAGNEALKPLGISIVQWDALRHLHAHPGSSLHDLAVLTFQTDQAFGTLATRMEARGLIRRTDGPGRAIRPELTPEGERVLAEGTRSIDAVLRASFERLSATERVAFGEMLARVVDDAPGVGI
ncbi:MarR family transcriptional regulator [Microbacterium sp. X-17]|uniref:MarR family winged helix-turn-helix transcriptional regulator n=1 Tax=Microbacterium sp. X-17 TaxID=3144404 RepID=UPI0031F5AEC0